ncbi:hypothetical protein [Acinetobacter larvae]|uniref:NTF2 fold immunity protein domain-containing protein n=1 Tax=Acinetobacter larvae TaxID=1789224 RepID=A0A1B2LVG7_9GAMM|nr:hypothetical protein [Acinetobacter larvae]AOA56905.1 hypothetical protein BFG52_00025 [Acinetobacter larvae]
MNFSFEQGRDAWVNAYYLGNVQQLQQYEAEDLLIHYQASGIDESCINRYNQIQHAVENAMWRPQKLDIVAEEFEFSDDFHHCLVRLRDAQDRILVEEKWRNHSGLWQIYRLTIF